MVAVSANEMLAAERDNAFALVSVYRDEIQQLGDFDYVVVNPEGQLDECVAKLCAIIDAEKLKTKR